MNAIEERESRPSSRRTGLLLGGLYVAMSLPAAVDLMVIRRTLIVPADAEATAHNLLGGELLFRTGVALELMTGIVALVLATVYFGIFARHDRRLARLLAFFVIGGSMFEMLGGAFGALAMTFVRQPDYLIPFEAAQLNALAQAVLTFQNFLFSVAHIFWGLWLLPLGLLLVRSRGAPRAVALLLLLAGCVYVLGSLTATILPGYSRTFAVWAMIPEGLGEISFVMWIMIFGFAAAPAAPGPEEV